MKIAAVSLAIGLSGIGASQAATLAVTQANGNVFGAEGQRWYQKVSFSINQQQPLNVLAGAFRLIATNGTGEMAPFMAFCLSPLETLVLPKDYDVSTTLSTAVVARLRALANGAWSQIVSKTSAAAFQIAAWEIVTETDTGALDVRDGAFRLTSKYKQTGKLADKWLDAVETGQFKAAPHHTTILSAEGTQDLLTNDLSPVPLPGALGFLTFGLAAFAAIGRARRV